jgi:hypothetical protein
MKKSTKCAVLLAVLLLFSAGVNSIFIATAGGWMAKQTQQVEREGWTSQRTAAVECMREAEHCSPAVR